MMKLKTLLISLFAAVSIPLLVTAQHNNAALATTAQQRVAQFFAGGHSQQSHAHPEAPPEKHIFHSNDDSGHQCAFDQRHEYMMANDATYALEMNDRERMIGDLIDADLNGQRNGVLTMPVVVHIIHKGEPIGSGTNISDAQIHSAIAGLNEDYRKVPGTNGDGNGVDVEIEFCLAVRDPNNNPHSGINRVDGTSVALYDEEGITAGQGSGANEMAIKNLSRWPNQQYYNIWVVSEIEDNDGGAGIQGYAYFPTTSQVDGTVILYNAFGTVGNLKSYTNLNRTTTHELGHALNLYHTFQGNSCSESNCSTQGDRVCDTPATTMNSNCNNPACGGSQQVENYLDYTSQLCKNTFTQGQKDRMRAALLGARANLLTSQACVPVNNLDAGITNVSQPTGQLCTTTINPEVTLTNFGSTTLTSIDIVYSVNGINPQTFQWTGSLATGSSQIISLPATNGPAGGGTFMATTENPNGSADQNMSNDTSTSSYASISGNGISITIVTDFYGTETTWELINNNNEVVANGGPYINGALGTAYQHDACVADGCYEFRIYDSFGDGICCNFGPGSYTVTDGAGNTLASGGNFGNSEITPFCISGTGGVAPQANFIASETEICAGESIDFTDASLDEPATWLWTFEGGTPSTSTDPNPSGITYTNAGTFNVTLVATNPHGSSTEIKSNYIQVSESNTWFIDNDGDGYGNPFTSINSCSQPAGYVDNPGDCNDNDPDNFDNCYDCAGAMWGSAYIDNCGTCVAGITGLNPCLQDCNGDWGGTAFTDDCGNCVGGNTGNSACVSDCAGVPGGSAFTDNCGNCVGGNTGNIPCVQDCNGDWGGNATTDNCGNCVGGNTGATACAQDCNGTWGGTAFIDGCGECVGGSTGNNACASDCAGVPGGSAFTDNCGNCVGGNTGASPCVQDCNGTWGGTAFIDGCGECVGGTTGNNACASDCAGVPGGSAFTDNCGNCVGGNTGNIPCVQDCNGDWGGTATTDNCGNCVGGNTGATACIQDCNGTWGGTAFIDGCGECVGGTTGNNACANDCAGVPGGSAFTDNCGNCVGGNTGNTPCVQDCNGDWGGTATIDNCGNCVGGNTGASACVQDCNGTWGGTAFIDGCGECVGGTTGNNACANDCAGVPGGSAFTDNCGNCVGGNTGNTPCVQDCNGDWGGTATIDNCGNCVGGNTGASACVQDCNGTWGGTAYIDGCGECVGGTTGSNACANDCAGVPGGSAFTDNCGNCVGGNTGNTPCVQDCNGDWGGTAAIDDCGVCAGGNTGTDPCDPASDCSEFNLNVINSNNPLCYGEASGNIAVSASGGSENVSYIWSDGTNSNQLLSVAAGTYTVEATDNETGCTASLTFTLENPSAINFGSAEIMNPSCPGMSNGTISINASGGTGDLDFLWNDQSGQNGPVASNLTSGQYTVTATDENGCTASATYTLEDEEGISVEVITVDAGCEGIATGEAIVLPEGGTGNYAINWSEPGNAQQQLIQNLGPGNYSVWVTDQAGCMEVVGFTIGIDCPFTAELEEGVEEEEEEILPEQPSNADYTVQPEDGNPVLQLYPNPGNGEFINMNFSQKNASSEDNQLATVQLTNMAGQTIIQQQIVLNEGKFHSTINFDKKLPFGIYLLSVNTQNQSIIQKIVVK